jgi:hypothetical protein
MIALGVFEFFTGAVLDGTWIAFIGWFLRSAASTEEAAHHEGRSHQGPGRAATASPVVTLRGWLIVDEFLNSVAPGYLHTTYPP